jgi:O-antigen/teichoic acid export membrane protein
MYGVTNLLTRLRGTFLTDVLKLSFGTLGGRLISIATLPLITRLYSPEDFALLAIYLALVSPFAVVACLRVEIAIPLVETDAEAADVLALALSVLALVTALLTIPAFLMPDLIAAALGASALAPYFWLVPLGVAVAGSYSALQSWATRARRFGAIALTQVGQAGVGVSAVLALGWAGIAPFGLLLGNMLNIGAGGLSLAASALASDGARLRAVRLRNLGRAFRRNHRYPLFSTPEALFNAAGVQVPVLLIAAHAGAEAGFLFLAMQVMTAPMILLGSSIAQVYVSRAPTEYREGRLAPFTLAIMRRLVVLGMGPLILAGALAPVVFPWVFGAEWARAGEIVMWLVPWMAFQLLASPVSMVLHTVGRQSWAMYLQAAGLAIRIGVVFTAISVSADPVIAFALASATFYAFYSYVVIIAARLKSTL